MIIKVDFAVTFREGEEFDPHEFAGYLAAMLEIPQSREYEAEPYLVTDVWVKKETEEEDDET